MLKNFAQRSLYLVRKSLSANYSIYASARLNHKILSSYHLQCFTNTNNFYVIHYSTAGPTTPDNEQSQETSKQSFSEKEKILSKALTYVMEYGWSEKAIEKGAEDIGCVVSSEMFENQGSDLVMYFVKQSNQKLLEYMKEKVDEKQKSDLKGDENLFVRDAIEYRLRLIIPYVDVWAEAMQLLLHPSILNESTDELSKMVDDIWVHAGDKSTDVEWYAKRGFLAQLYGGLQLVMLTDQSSDYKETWKFLHLRS